jgi:hypothetical protein
VSIEENMNEMKFADNVWHRVIQVVQEAMLTGVDCADLLRQVRVVPDETDPHVLVLSPDYQKQVRSMHEKLLSQAREIQAQQTGNKFIVPGSDNGESN